MASSKIWTETLDPDAEKPGPWKTWTLKNMDPEKTGLRNSWMQKNKKKKRLEDRMV